MMEEYEIHLTRNEVEDLLSMLQVVYDMTTDKNDSRIMSLERKPLFFINFLRHVIAKPVAIGAGPQPEEIPDAS